MRQWIAKHPSACRALGFLLILTLLLEGLSWMADSMGRDRNPMLNYSTTSFFDEPKDTIDVLTIGTSDVYSAVAPMQWWGQYGYTGYTWGEASQRIFETYRYLKKIYRVQSPKVVFLEIGDLYRDNTRPQVLDSIVKTQIARVFPVIIDHRNLVPRKLVNLGSPKHSVTKGFLFRATVSPASRLTSSIPAGNGKTAPVDSLCSAELKRCITLCEKHGTQVVLLSVPDRSAWSTPRHDAVEALAEQDGVPYLDLNVTLKDVLNWDTDCADSGSHMNFRGAEKVSAAMGEYLTAHYSLTDHRQDAAYAGWNQDWAVFSKKLRSLEK